MELSSGLLARPAICMGNSLSNSGRGDERSHVTGDIRSDGNEREHRPVITELANNDDEEVEV